MCLNYSTVTYVREGVGVELDTWDADRQTDGRTNPNYSMINTINLINLRSPILSKK